MTSAGPGDGIRPDRRPVLLEEASDVHDDEHGLQGDVRPDPEDEVETQQGHARQQAELAESNGVALRVGSDDEDGSEPADELDHRATPTPATRHPISRLGSGMGTGTARLADNKTADARRTPSVRCRR